MPNPQQPELRRSETTILEPDSIGSELEARKRPGRKGRAGKVPEDNKPGHHPPEEQDQPDPEAFVNRFSTGRRRTRRPTDAEPEPPRAAEPSESTDLSGGRQTVADRILTLTGQSLRVTAKGFETAGWVVRKVAAAVEPGERRRR